MSTVYEYFRDFSSDGGRTSKTKSIKTSRDKSCKRKRLRKKRRGDQERKGILMKTRLH